MATLATENKNCNEKKKGGGDDAGDGGKKGVGVGGEGEAQPSDIKLYYCKDSERKVIGMTKHFSPLICKTRSYFNEGYSIRSREFCIVMVSTRTPYTMIDQVIDHYHQLH